MVSRQLRLVRRVVVGAVVLLVLGIGGGLVYARPLLKTGTGYAAHNACAVQLLAGRGADQPSQDLPDNPLVPFLRTSVTQAGPGGGGGDGAGSARSNLLGVLYGQTAYYTPGRGCTIARERPSVTTPRPVTASPAALRAAASPAPPAVHRAVDAAFGERPADRERLNTRAVVVVHGGQIVAERYAAGFTADTRQLGWSMGKSVANLMAGRLVAEGKLALGDTRLRPEWTDERAGISVEHLLRMSSGLQWNETYDLGTSITRMLYLEPDMGGYAASLPAAHAPGSYQQYSSGTTNILCQVLEQRSGLGADMAAELILSPLGLSSAVWEPDAAGHPVCSSYLWATPRDWATIGQFALQEGRWNGRQLLPTDWMRFSTSTVGVQSEDDGYGAHWWVNRRHDGILVHPLMPADAYWAAGHDGQQVVVVPSADLVVVRMGFTPDGADLGVDRLVSEVATALRA